MLEKTFEKSLFLFVAITLGSYFFNFNLIFVLVTLAFFIGLVEVATHCILVVQTSKLDANKVLKRMIYKFLLPLLIYVLFWLRLELVQRSIITFNLVPTAHILATFALMREVIACCANSVRIYSVSKLK